MSGDIDMAGDWIKFEVGTLDKPEVCQIADLAGIDIDAVVGKLLRVWAWFDQQTEDGNAPSVTRKLLDRVVGVTGFCDHMKTVGWLIDEEGVICLPNFDRHNGQTAKNRAVTAKRVGKHRTKSNDDGNGDSVTKIVPKEEKRREDKEQDQKLLADSFTIFWKLYPRKVNKDNAAKAWKKISKADIEPIMKSLSIHVLCEQWVKDDGKFIPHAASWLNAKRWEDEVKPYAPGKTNGQGNRAGRLSAVDQVRAENDAAEARRRAARPADESSGNLQETAPIEGDWEREFASIRDADGKIVGDDGGPVRP